MKPLMESVLLGVFSCFLVLAASPSAIAASQQQNPNVTPRGPVSRPPGLPAPAPTLTSPNGGEQWRLGSTKMITWTYINPAAKMHLILLKNGQQLGIIQRNVPNTGTYSWKVGQHLGGSVEPGAGYTIQVKVAGAKDVFDASNRPFVIEQAVFSSAAGTALKAGVMGSPTIESWLGIPGGPLMPGTRVYLKGKHFGTQPGKIVLFGSFPSGSIELQEVTWTSAEQANGKVPGVMGSVASQTLSLRLQRKDSTWSNTLQMDFLGQAEYKCDELWRSPLILARGGPFGPTWKPAQDCTPYICRKDATGVGCWPSCDTTAKCATGYRCDSQARCVHE